MFFLTKSTTEALTALEAGTGSLAMAVAVINKHRVRMVAILDFMTLIFLSLH